MRPPTLALLIGLTLPTYLMEDSCSSATHEGQLVGRQLEVSEQGADVRVGVIVICYPPAAAG